ncbi:Peptidyl-tRNA hydrolase [Nymphaea thermarum]|nr:Peptidyl-tRNA hydrolase [Nymphaea thermarum]
MLNATTLRSTLPTMPRLPSCSQSPYSAPISRYLLLNRFRRRPVPLRPKIRTVSWRSMSATASDSSVDSKPKPWLLVGLGNPGKKYEGTRHNVGFEMLDTIAEEEGISVSSIRFKALFGKGTVSGVPVLLAKPQTFMNVSGQSIYDDMDLPFATLRLLPKGGHGGHNGMRSVIDHFKGSRDFPRLRIGIGRPPGKMDPVNFVLRPFTRQEREELNVTLQKGLEGVRILLLEGFNKSASFVNQAKASNLLNS